MKYYIVRHWDVNIFRHFSKATNINDNLDKKIKSVKLSHKINGAYNTVYSYFSMRSKYVWGNLFFHWKTTKFGGENNPEVKSEGLHLTIKFRMHLAQNY